MPSDRESRTATCAARARQVWDAMNANEQHGVRFGLFPAHTMRAFNAGVSDAPYTAHEMACALMAVAGAV